jgi:hypothetical protein
METLKSKYDLVASEAVDILQTRYKDEGDLYSRLERYHASDQTLQQFWKVITAVPQWVDWEQVRRGQLVFKRYAFSMMIGFAFQGFAGEIVAAPGPAKVLDRTGSLSRHNITPRVEATLLQWLMKVTQSPESLRVDGQGFISTIRVRLRHAAVNRHMVNASNSSSSSLDATPHDIPINTYDSILILTFFCCNPIWKQLPQLGVHLSIQEVEDFVALYRFLAYLLGVPDEYFSSAVRAKKTMDDMKDGKNTPSEVSKKITSEFIDASADRAPYNVSRGFILAGIWSMNSCHVCDALDLESVGWTPYIAFTGLRWFVMSAACLRRAGFPLPPDIFAIKVSEDSLLVLQGVQLISLQKVFSILPGFEDHAPRTEFGGSLQKHTYESAFPARHPKSNDCSKTCRYVLSISKRPVETMLLIIFGTICLLGTTLAFTIAKLLMMIIRLT